jgi:hypothetical protein
MAEYVITTIRDLLEGYDAASQRMINDLMANTLDDDLARRVHLRAKRIGKAMVVTIGAKKHVVEDWHMDGQITTMAFQYGTGRRMWHNHSNWESLTDNMTFTVSVE